MQPPADPRQSRMRTSGGGGSDHVIDAATIHRRGSAIMAPPRASQGAARVPRSFAFLLAVVTYLDRICISAAAPFIMRRSASHGAPDGRVFSAFTLAYSMFEIPSGWLGDVQRARGAC